MCPIPNLPLPLIGENITCISSFQTKRFKCSYSKKYILLNLIIGKYWNHGKNLQDLPGQNDWENVGLV